MSHDPYQALRFSAFRRYLAGHVLAVLGQGMLAVTIGWEIYERTRSAWALGMVGVAQVVPLILLILPAGQLADSSDRRRLLVMAEATIGLAALGLWFASRWEAPIEVYYGLLVLYGVGRTFQLPAKQSIMPNLVPIESLQNAVAWNSGGWQGADMIGPALGGFIIHWAGPGTVYALCAAAALIFMGLVSRIEVRGPARSKAPVTWHGFLEGIRFVRRSPVLLAAMSLDLFAVLLGGVIALLPVFAKEILIVGPVGLGWLRAAQSFGAVLVSVTLAHRPPFKRAGRTLLTSVAGFGLAIVIFGLSQNYFLSMAMLFLAGGCDAISVIIRLALAQLHTPDELRGRVSAVNSLFIGMSNELGEAESGILASWIGPVGAVVAGGVGVIGVVTAVGVAWPELRTLDRLTEAGA